MRVRMRVRVRVKARARARARVRARLSERKLGGREIKSERENESEIERVRGRLRE